MAVKRMTGAVPMRSEHLSRERNANRKSRNPVELKKGQMTDVVFPDPDPEWHPTAKMLWEGAISSGMASYYQNSDIAYLYSLCEDLSGQKKSAVKFHGKMNGQILSTIYSAMSTLGLTEGDRRRMRIELEWGDNKQGEDAAVTALDEYRAKLGLTG